MKWTPWLNDSRRTKFGNAVKVFTQSVLTELGARSLGEKSNRIVTFKYDVVEFGQLIKKNKYNRLGVNNQEICIMTAECFAGCYW